MIAQSTTLSLVALKGSSYLRQMDVQTTSGERGSIRHSGRLIQLEWNESHNLWQEKGIADSRLKRLVQADII